MRKISFTAYGHKNIIGLHKSTLELTSDRDLTITGTCIVGVRMDMTLDDLDNEIRNLAKDNQTRIVLRMTVDNLTEIITGRGSSRLTYNNPISMVARTSVFECGRTLMVNADKAASDLSRDFVRKLVIPDTEIHCELQFISGG